MQTIIKCVVVVVLKLFVCQNLTSVLHNGNRAQKEKSGILPVQVHKCIIFFIQDKLMSHTVLQEVTVSLGIDSYLKELINFFFSTSSLVILHFHPSIPFPPQLSCQLYQPEIQNCYLGVNSQCNFKTAFCLFYLEVKA